MSVAATALISPQDQGTRPPCGDPAPLRQALRQGLRDGLAELFARSDRGEAVAALVRARSRQLDEALCAAWTHHIPKGHSLALVAVGGYGRGELHPGSDVDILILVSPEALDALQEQIGQLVTFLFDLGLDLGHSVRTLDECIAAAGDDVTIMTNLLETRHLAGDHALLDALLTATGPDRIWPSGAFFTAKVAEQRERWLRFGGTAYNLEPNIKENPGGLRDIQMIGWVAKRHFATANMHDLVSHGFLTEAEYRALCEGQLLLWRIRFALHRLAGRHEDRVSFDFQRTLAAQFGFCDGENNLAVEQFMQQYYRTVMELNRLNEMLLQHFREVCLLGDALGPPDPHQRPLPGPQRLHRGHQRSRSSAAVPWPCWRSSCCSRPTRKSRGCAPAQSA